MSSGVDIVELESTAPHIHSLELQRARDRTYGSCTGLKVHTKEITTNHPIARLPSELLSFVFEEYSAEFWSDYAQNSKIEYPARTPHKWFHILHVCRSWRRTALETPRLWTCVVPTSPDFVEYAIPRSGSLALWIRYYPYAADTDDDTVTRIYRCIFQSLPRIHTLELKATLKTLASLRSVQPRTRTLPCLTDLRLGFHREAMSTSVPPFHGISLPNLTALSVTSGTMRAIYPLFQPTLKKLSLRDCSVTVPNLVDFLAGIPGIQELRICNTSKAPLWFGVHTLPAATHTINLPELRLLSLHETEGGLISAGLFTHLILPRDTSVDLRTGDMRYLMDSSTILHTLIPKSVGSHSFSFQPRSIELLSGYQSGLNIRLWSQSQSWNYSSAYDKHETDDQPRLSICLSYKECFRECASSFILSQIDLREVVTLSLANTARPAMLAWNLGEMDTLENLVIRGSRSLYDVFTAMPTRLTLPNLKRLELVDVSCWRGEGMCPPFTKIFKHCREHGSLPQLELLVVTRPLKISRADIDIISDPAFVERSVINDIVSYVEDEAEGRTMGLYTDGQGGWFPGAAYLHISEVANAVDDDIDTAEDEDEDEDEDDDEESDEDNNTDGEEDSEDSEDDSEDANSEVDEL